MHHKKTLTGLLTNFFSFTSFSYKVGLIRTLVDRAYKINNSLLSFNKDVKKLTHIFKKNQFPEHSINKVVSTYLDKNNTSALSDNNDTFYFRLPYLPFSNFVQRKLRALIKTYCNDLKIKLVFSSFKIKNLIRVKDFVPRSLHSCVVYKFTCAECNSVYCMLVKQPETYQLVFVSIFFQIKILIYLNISKVLMPVKMLVMRPVLKL